MFPEGSFRRASPHSRPAHAWLRGGTLVHEILDYLAEPVIRRQVPSPIILIPQVLSPDLEPRVFLQYFAGLNKPMQASGRWVRWRKQPWSTEKGCVRSPLHLIFTAQVLDTDRSISEVISHFPLVSPSNTATMPAPAHVWGGRHIAHALCYSPDRLLVASKFPNDGCFSCLQGFPHSRDVCRGKRVRGFRADGVDGQAQRDCAVDAVRGAWGYLRPLPTADRLSLERPLSSRPPQGALRCSEN